MCILWVTVSWRVWPSGRHNTFTFAVALALEHHFSKLSRCPLCQTLCHIIYHMLTDQLSDHWHWYPWYRMICVARDDVLHVLLLLLLTQCCAPRIMWQDFLRFVFFRPASLHLPHLPLVSCHDALQVRPLLVASLAEYPLAFSTFVIAGVEWEWVKGENAVSQYLCRGFYDLR